MPMKNGFETLKEIKDMDSGNNIPVVMLSTSSRDTSAPKALSLGASEYICKPSSFNELRNEINTVLENLKTYSS